MEDDHQVQSAASLEAGFATPIFHRASGRALEEALGETEMAPGEFVRNCKQLLDLLRQVEEVAKPEVATLFRHRAVVGHPRRRRVHRGVATMWQL